MLLGVNVPDRDDETERADWWALTDEFFREYVQEDFPKYTVHPSVLNGDVKHTIQGELTPVLYWLHVRFFLLHVWYVQQMLTLQVNKDQTSDETVLGKCLFHAWRLFFTENPTDDHGTLKTSRCLSCYFGNVETRDTLIDVSPSCGFLEVYRWHSRNCVD